MDVDALTVDGEGRWTHIPDLFGEIEALPQSPRSDTGDVEMTMDGEDCPWYKAEIVKPAGGNSMAPAGANRAVPEPETTHASDNAVAEDGTEGTDPFDNDSNHFSFIGPSNTYFAPHNCEYDLTSPGDTILSFPSLSFSSSSALSCPTPTSGYPIVNDDFTSCLPLTISAFHPYLIDCCQSNFTTAALESATIDTAIINFTSTDSVAFDVADLGIPENAQVLTESQLESLSPLMDIEAAGACDKLSQDFTQCDFGGIMPLPPQHGLDHVTTDQPDQAKPEGSSEPEAVRRNCIPGRTKAQQRRAITIKKKTPSLEAQTSQQSPLITLESIPNPPRVKKTTATKGSTSVRSVKEAARKLAPQSNDMTHVFKIARRRKYLPDRGRFRTYGPFHSTSSPFYIQPSNATFSRKYCPNVLQCNGKNVAYRVHALRLSDADRIVDKDGHEQPGMAVFRRNNITVACWYELLGVEHGQALDVVTNSKNEPAKVNALALKLRGVTELGTATEDRTLWHAPEVQMKTVVTRNANDWLELKHEHCMPGRVIDADDHKAIGVACAVPCLPYQCDYDMQFEEERKIMDPLGYHSNDGNRSRVILTQVQFERSSLKPKLRERAQEYFHLAVGLYADVRVNRDDEPDWCKIGEVYSDPIHCHGRAPNWHRKCDVHHAIHCTKCMLPSTGRKVDNRPVDELIITGLQHEADYQAPPFGSNPLSDS